MKTKKITLSGLALAVILIQVLVLFNSCKSKELCPLPEAVTYTKDVAVVIEEKCFMCHAPDVYKKKASRNKIYDYESLKKMGESGFLVGAITHAKGYVAMPYKKGVKIDTCAIALISKWVDTGMKE